MSSNTKWLPFYVADYLGDTMHLTTLQHGAYVLLLMHYWRNGPLPNDDGKLAQIARMDRKAWQTINEVLREFFTVNGDGTLHQKRMDWELRRWGEIADKRREAGKRGAEAKHRPHPIVEKPAGMPAADVGKRVANAKQVPSVSPVDNLANATILPDQNVANAKQVPSVCQDFASVHLHPQRERNTYLGEESRARARRDPTSREVLAQLPPDHLRQLLEESLRVADAEAAKAKERYSSHTPEVQQAAVRRPRAIACNHLSGAELAAARKVAGIEAAA